MAMEKLWTGLLLLPLLFMMSYVGDAGRPSFWRPRTLGEFSIINREKSILQSSQYEYETKYFTQRLDHFSFKNHKNSSFQQRYLINDKYWLGAKRMGPIFLYCGNEGYIDWFAVNAGFMWDIAPQFGALLVFPEHRYYGESMPYGSQSVAYKDGDSLSYLTAEQALADFATLIVDLKKNLSAEACPVVLFGGSYGGMLAAWMRLKYPHIAIGALASSAPILQFEDIVPSDIFYNLVSNDFKRESENCFKVIQQSWKALETYGERDEGLQNLSKKFRMCRDLKSTDEVQDWLNSAYCNLAMVDYPYPASFLMPLPGYPIKEILDCPVIVTLTSMSPTSNDLLHLESKQGTSSFEKSLLVCKNASSVGDESSSSCRGSLRTTDLPESQVLGKIKDFLQVMGEANHKLQKDIQDKGLREYDIEVLKGEEEQYIEMDLALGVAELHTPEALAAAESAMVGQDQTLPISATSNDGDSSSEGNDYSDSSCETGDDDNEDGDESGEGNARHSAIKSQKSKRTRFTINRKGLKRPKIEVLQ